MANRKFICPLHELQQELIEQELTNSKKGKRKKRPRKKKQVNKSCRRGQASTGARH